jgi:small-conductance mechanosensitive channel
MSELMQWVSSHWATITRTLIILVVGIIAGRACGRLVGRIVARRSTAQASMLARRLVMTIIYALLLMTVLNGLGFDLKVLAGAAGILTVAIGFASQTSASNIISGLFLVGERPFVVGDVVRIGATTGEVIAIDLLSVKLRTFDNLFIRIPNETVIKSEVTNLTHFPIRRFDLQVGLPYEADLNRMKALLLEVANASRRGLEEPEPSVLFLGYGESSVNVQLSVWATREDFGTLRFDLAAAVKAALEAEGAAIPFARREIEMRAPVDVRVVSAQD